MLKSPSAHLRTHNACLQLASRLFQVCPSEEFIPILRLLGADSRLLVHAYITGMHVAYPHNAPVLTTVSLSQPTQPSPCPYSPKRAHLTARETILAICSRRIRTFRGGSSCVTAFQIALIREKKKRPQVDSIDRIRAVVKSRFSNRNSMLRKKSMILLFLAA